MRRAILSALFLLSSSLSFGAISGDYEGKYTSSDGNVEGQMRTSLLKKDDQTWDCKYFFHYNGEEVSTKPVSCLVQEKKLTAEYDAEVEGTAIRIKLTGEEAEDATIAGAYTATDPTGNVVGEGKWTLSQKR